MLKRVVAMAQHGQELNERDEGEKAEMQHAERLDEHGLIVERGNRNRDVEHVFEAILREQNGKDESDPERV